MTDTTFTDVFVQLRLQQVDQARQEHQLAQCRLSTLRDEIARIDQAIQRCLAVARQQAAGGRFDIARGNHREARGMTLMRARHVASLAAAKTDLQTTRRQLEKALMRARQLSPADLIRKPQPTNLPFAP
jgi:hypothetical protein